MQKLENTSPSTASLPRHGTVTRSTRFKVKSADFGNIRNQRYGGNSDVSSIRGNDARGGHINTRRQRDDALARGIDLIEWTFDPLELKNAWFNLEGLGAVIRRYVRNQYGFSSSALQSGLPTDRCVAEWWIKKDRFRPAVVERVRATPVRSREVQEELATRFEACFARGLTAFGVERTGDSIDYLFGVVPE